MTFDKSLFKGFQPTNITKVRIGNGKHIVVEGKGIIAITTCSSTKTISDVLFVPKIDHNLLSVGQLLEKAFKGIFEDKCCLVKDISGQELFNVKMRGKSFLFDPT